MLKHLLPLACVAALWPALAAGQLNYKSTMPDGKVVYGDKPAPGAVKVEQLKGAPTKGINVTSPQEAAALRQMEASRAGRQASSQKARAAEEAMKRAEAAMAAGKEPGEGDRIGTASGAQRFSDQYWERQKRLAAEYEVARANYEKALREADAPPAQRPGSGAVSPDGTGGGTPGSAGSTPNRRGQ